MRKRSEFCLFLTLRLLWTALAWGQSSYQVEATAAPPASALPQNLVAALRPDGIRVLGDKGAVLCEVWFSKSPVGSGGAGGAVYPGLEVGTPLGVLHFPRAASDFRG